MCVRTRSHLCCRLSAYSRALSFPVVLHAFFIAVSDYIDKAQQNGIYGGQETANGRFEYLM